VLFFFSTCSARWENVAYGAKTWREYLNLTQFNRSIPVGLKFVFGLFCTIVAKGAFGVFVCVKINNVSYLADDFNVQCNSSDSVYMNLVAYAAFGILQVVIIPAVALILLWLAIRPQGGWDKATKDWSVRFMMDMFVSEKEFENNTEYTRAWWFESFRVYRKLLFVLVARVVPKQAEQFMYAICLLTLSVLVVSKNDPFLSTTANRVEVTAQVLLHVSLVIASTYFTAGGSAETEADSSARIAAAAVVLATLLFTTLLYVGCIIRATLAERQTPLREQGQNEPGSRRSLFQRFSTMFTTPPPAENVINVELMDCLPDAPSVAAIEAAGHSDNGMGSQSSAGGVVMTSNRLSLALPDSSDCGRQENDLAKENQDLVLENERLQSEIATKDDMIARLRASSLGQRDNHFLDEDANDLEEQLQQHQQHRQHQQQAFDLR
jgi:hypothetical protein